MENTVIIIGVIAFILSRYFNKKRMEFLAVSVETECRVVDVVQEYDFGSDGSTTVFYPIIEYKDIYGKVHTKKHLGGSNPPRYQIGNVIKIRYSRENPEKYEFVSSSNIDKVLLIVSVILIIGGIIGHIEKQL